MHAYGAGEWSALDSQLHHIGVGRAWARTPVLMLIRELNIRIITETDGGLIRELVLDPSATTSHKTTRWTL
jgi:hypothetical protein